MPSFTLFPPLGDSDSNWSVETVKAYYRDPRVEWFRQGEPVNGGPIAEDGFYILHVCGDPDCHRPEGPFKTADDARAWSRENLVEDGH